MSDRDVRLSQLQQIPLFALRRTLIEFASDPNNAGILLRRFEEVLDKTSGKLEATIKKLTREQATKIIDSIAEFSDSEIQELFEEYRYGQNPFFSCL